MQPVIAGSMKQGKVIGFNAAKMAEQMMANAVAEQNRRLVEYAKEEILALGGDINAINSKHNFDDTGNLLDSLCWIVCYDGKMVDSGFYRNQRATKPSNLHSYSSAAILEGGTRKWKELYNQDVQKAKALQKANWSYESAAEPVNGHQLAEEYIQKAAKSCKAGEWKVTFAICAPYWGYWEEGHYNLFYKRFVKFNILTWHYDKIKSDLKPAKMRFNVHVEKYASKSLASSAKRNLKNPNRLDEW